MKDKRPAIVTSKIMERDPIEEYYSGVFRYEIIRKNDIFYYCDYPHYWMSDSFIDEMREKAVETVILEHENYWRVCNLDDWFKVPLCPWHHILHTWTPVQLLKSQFKEIEDVLRWLYRETEEAKVIHDKTKTYQRQPLPVKK